jgi:hypothetical protein
VQKKHYLSTVTAKTKKFAKIKMCCTTFAGRKFSISYFRCQTLTVHFFINAISIMRNFLTFLGLALLLSNTAYGQHRSCASDDVLQQQLAENPLLRQVREEIENHTHDFVTHQGVSERAVVTIPVVVNVVWNTAAQNISDAQILTQIDVLNADFRKLNADVANVPAAFQSLVADCEVNFCLATQDPTGAATTGIRRRQTTVTSFGTNDAMKYTAQGGLDIWDRNKYLNLWVCNISGSILGYAQFPGGPAATDGVVIDYLYFGTIGTATAPFNKGRTGTHEVGHWLNCYHIWGDDGTSCTGSDNVSDTPNQADENYGCPAFPQVSCSNGPNGDMFMNYMDYTDDACMYMFTNGQKARMQALFASGGARAALATSTGCQPPTGGGTCAVPSGLSATSITSSAATLNWGAASGAVTYNLQWKLSTSGTWTTVSGLTGTSYNLTGLAASSTYNYQVQTVCSSTSSAYSTAASFTTLASGGGGCADTYEPNNSRNGSATIPVNTTFTAQIATASDVDWYRFSNTSATRNIKIDLTTLPADYDVRLFRSNSQLAISQNAGTASEQIIFNTTTVSTSYYANVYGYNGASSNTSCYTLRVSLSASSWRQDGSTDGAVEEIEIPVEVVAFGLFPNPATDQVTIEVPMVADADVNISIIDAAGRTVAQQSSLMGKSNNRAIFPLTTLNNGVYFVQVRNGEQSSVRKLVIQK